MSFSSEVKKYLCDIKERRICCRKALLYGILQSSEIHRNRIIFKTEHECVAKLAEELISLLYPFKAGIITVNNSFELYIESTHDIDFILEDLPLKDSNIEKMLFNCEHCKSVFIRGVFLGCGNVTSPEKSYHLELFVGDEHIKEVQEILEENDLSPKSIIRTSKLSLYYKDSSQIEDFLAFIGAAKHSLEVMNTKITKEMRNNINRITNCETANIDKAATAAAIQLEAIRKLDEIGEIGKLPPELKETALKRIEFPELSLEEFRHMFSPEISKSGIYHRLQKIVAIAEEI